MYPTFTLCSIAGLTSSVEEQLQNILNVTASGLTRVSASRRSTIDKRVAKEEKERAKKPRVASQPETNVETSGEKSLEIYDNRESSHQETARRQRNLQDVEAVQATPIVVIRNFSPAKGKGRSDEVLDVISRWASSLAENQVRSINSLRINI